MASKVVWSGGQGYLSQRFKCSRLLVFIIMGISESGSGV